MIPIRIIGKGPLPDQGLTGVACAVPRDRIYVQEDGNFYHCCTHWMPYTFGNIKDTTILEYYKSRTYHDVELSVTDGSFKYCDADICPGLQNHKVTGAYTGGLVAVQDLKERTMRDMDLSKQKWLEVTLNYDRSCNLACPSCRNELLLTKHDEALDNIHQRTIQSLTELLDDGYKVSLSVTSAGDPFASLRYLDIIKNFDHPSGNYDFVLVTNGTLLTQARLEYPNIKERAIGFVVSVDAATKETYSKVRRLGDFDDLTANLKNLDAQMKQGFFARSPLFSTNFVLSAMNFRELPQFVHQMLELESMNSVWINLIADWGHLPNFNDYAVWMESHPDHDEFLKVMQDPVLKHPKLQATNAVRFING